MGKFILKGIYNLVVHIFLKYIFAPKFRKKRYSSALRKYVKYIVFENC